MTMITVKRQRVILLMRTAAPGSEEIKKSTAGSL